MNPDVRTPCLFPALKMPCEFSVSHARSICWYLANRFAGASRIIAFMGSGLLRFVIFWGVNTLSLWVADELFDGIAFRTLESLFVSGLLLGVVNSVIKPLLILLTLPLSVVTLGFFVLVINALMLLLVAWLVPGLVVSGFWSGFIVALFVSVLSFVVNSIIGANRVTVRRIRRN